MSNRCICSVGRCGIIHGTPMFDGDDSQCTNTKYIRTKDNICRSCWMRMNSAKMNAIQEKKRSILAVQKAKDAFKALNDRTYPMPGFEKI